MCVYKKENEKTRRTHMPREGAVSSFFSIHPEMINSSTETDTSFFNQQLATEYARTREKNGARGSLKKRWTQMSSFFSIYPEMINSSAETDTNPPC